MNDNAAKAFDKLAGEYDTSFSYTKSGRMQRKRVWHYLDKLITNKKHLNILEAACGTGLDALYLSEKGHSVTATDISAEMIQLCKAKQQTANKGRVIFENIGLSNLDEKYKGREFDLLFSNFGGLNCLDQASLESFCKKIPTLLKADANLVLVIMGRFCLWECLYFLIRFDFNNAFRRWQKKGVSVNIKGVSFRTYYYSPADIQKLLSKDFECVLKRPIGLFLPTSYLDIFFWNKGLLLRILNKLESTLSWIPFGSNFSDHYYISFKKKDQAK